MDASKDEMKRSKRKVLKTNRFEFDALENEEQLMIQQAIKNSQKDHHRVEYPVPEALTYYPTIEEFMNPTEYINKISEEAAQMGICKIVPPIGWNPICPLTMEYSKRFPTRVQNIHTLQEGKPFADGKMYTLKSYKEMADNFRDDWAAKYNGGEPLTEEMIAKQYWEVVETSSKPVTVEYGNDLDTSEFGSGFPTAKDETTLKQEPARIFSEEFYMTSPWNITKLPSCRGSLLKHITAPINGINVPWLYVGMMFASFCWHTEDNYLYSINYSHFGAAKQWYGVPASSYKQFEKVSKDFLLASFRESPDLLHFMTTQISPSLLLSNDVPVYGVSHEAGTFVITFPRAYHAGFSYGFNVGEAVNFAIPNWLKIGAEAVDNYRSLSRPSVFSFDRLLFTVLNNINDSSMSEYVVKEGVLRVAEDELSERAGTLAAGVRDLSGLVSMPANNFSVIDKESLEYDDLRTCYLCKHICIFSAVACECDRAKVTCLGHGGVLCKCHNSRKFLLTWASDSALRDVQSKMTQLIASWGRKQSSTASSSSPPAGEKRQRMSGPERS